MTPSDAAKIVELEAEIAVLQVERNAAIGNAGYKGEYIDFLKTELASKDELLKAQELVVAEKDAALAVAREALIVAASRLGDSTLFGCLSDERIDAMAKKLAADQRVFEAASNLSLTTPGDPYTGHGLEEWDQAITQLAEALKAREGL